jgi:pimeloyl-ACP methyl ester carboxylesterase
LKTEDFSEYCAESSTCQTRQIQVNDNVSLRVITFQPNSPAKNPPVVFIPGWISLIATWKSVLQDLSRDFTIHYIETREKKTAIVRGRVKYRVEDCARDLAAIVEQLNLQDDNFILCGSSLGATAIADGFRFLKRRPLFLVLIGIKPILYSRVGSRGALLFHRPYYAFYTVFQMVSAYFGWTLKKTAHNKKYCDMSICRPLRLKKAL